MNWKRRLQYDETELKALIDQLGDAQRTGETEAQDRAQRRLAAKLAQMSSYVEDCLSGRSDDERSVLLYKLRVEFPFFSHLSSLSGLPREYVEWSCA